MSKTERAALTLAAMHGSIVCACPGDARPVNGIAGRTFASLAAKGLLTHSSDGTPEPGFCAWVDGTEGYLTPAGRAEVAS